MIEKVSLSALKPASAACQGGPRPGTPDQDWLTRSVEDLEDVWPRSQDLKTAQCYAFQCADLLEVRCETIARARKAEPLFVAAVDAAGNPLMLLALAIERRQGLRTLTFLDGGLSDYNAPVLFAAAGDWD